MADNNTTSSTNLDESMQSIETYCDLFEDAPENEDPRTRFLRLCKGAREKKKDVSRLNEKLASEYNVLYKEIHRVFQQSGMSRKFFYLVNGPWSDRLRLWTNDSKNNPHPGPLKNMELYSAWGRACKRGSV